MARAASKDAPVSQEEAVAVTIYLSGNVDEVVRFLEDNGGSPRNVGEDYIEAYVPVTLLGPVSEQPGVIRVREIIPPQPAQSTPQIAGHGPQAHLSEAWNQAGYRGQGVKVGIIDYWGFEDFSGLMGTELPATVVARCYTDIGVFTRDLADCEVDYDHGTKVAESLIDIAPEVSLYIANPVSRGDLQATVDWMALQGVSVINSSVLWTFDGPGDGTSPFSDSPLKTVDRAVDGGIIWVNSAGNEAQTTWFHRGPYSDPDNDGRINFAERDELINLSVRAEEPFTVQLRWDDSWPGASTDLDLYLLRHDTVEIIFGSEDYQSGESGHFPLEVFEFLPLIDTDILGIGIVHHSGSVPDWIQLIVEGVGSIEHYTENGSITNPAESANPGMLAVGASDWNDVNTIEPFSSRGPAPDGRVKPDIVGADCGETALLPLNENNWGFCGTSQAAPHVAGMAALVRQAFPDYSPVQVANYLKDNAAQRESPDPNNTWGHGFAQLPPPPAVEAACATGGAVTDAANNPGLVADCQALLAARDTLAGTGTLDWSASTPIANWEGVTVGGTPQRVTKLQLSFNQLTGTIPSSLGNLANLETLDLSFNQLSGSIPPELGNLANLRELELWGNELTGSIPPELGDLANLQELELWGNQLTGSIPPELGDLANLQELELWGNELTGSIPPELGDLANLQELELWGNELTGSIPPELGNLAKLTSLSLSGNQLTGSIPPELGNLANLQELELWGNQLTGSIPPELGDLANLQELDLDLNELTGWIPPELGNLANLRELRLWDNQLTGWIPPELGNLTNLETLSLSDNQLTGSIPSSLGNLTNLEAMRLDDNQLTGSVPSSLGNLTNLEVLYLAYNQLTGCIPAGLRDVADNDFTELGLDFCEEEEPTLLDRFDTDKSGAIDKDEVLGAISAYLFGVEGDVTKDDVLAVIRLYLFGG